MIFQNFIEILLGWFSLYFFPILVSILSIVIGYIIYFLLKKQLKNLAKHDKLESNTANNIIKLVKYLIVLIVLTAILTQFAESIGIITALITIVGGTIIGFAAMNTLGNTIAGIIIMVSRPFSVGDRLLYNDQIVDVLDIKLIYTKMEDLNGVEIYIPNQGLLTGKIVNYRKDGNVIRLGVVVTPGFEENQDNVQETLIKAAKNTEGILESPVPYVWINKFQNYAVEYEIFGFIKNITKLPYIQSDFHKNVLRTCKKNNIDIRTPLLLKQV